MKHLYFYKFSLIWVFTFLLGLAFSSCSEDKEITENDNVTDKAVTGGIQNQTSSSAIIMGYINVDQNTLILIQDFGVEYSTKQDFSSKSSEEAAGYTGRDFTVTLENLAPNTTYYYRTYIHLLSGMYIYGKTLSFKTDTVKLKISNISYSQAYIEVTDKTIFKTSTLCYSTNPNNGFIRYEYLNNYYNEGWKEYNTIFSGKVTIKGLKPGTTYYCYLTNSEGSTEIASFTTKALDLSRTKTTWTFSPLFDSYIDQYGNTIDVKWLIGIFKTTIATNLGNQFKYGIMSLLDSNEDQFEKLKRADYIPDDFLYYSESTNSPYTVSLYLRAQDNRYGDDIAAIISLLHRIEDKKGDVGEGEYAELKAMIDECEYIPSLIQAFVEIDGERIFIGDIIEK